MCIRDRSEAAGRGAAVIQESQPLVRGAGDDGAGRRYGGVHAGRWRGTAASVFHAADGAPGRH